MVRSGGLFAFGTQPPGKRITCCDHAYTGAPMIHLWRAAVQAANPQDQTMQKGARTAMDYESDNPDSGLPQDEKVLHWVACLQKVAASQDLQAYGELFKHFSPMIKAFAYKVPA